MIRAMELEGFSLLRFFYWWMLKYGKVALGEYMNSVLEFLLFMAFSEATNSTTMIFLIVSFNFI